MGYFVGISGRFSRMDWWLAQLLVGAGIAFSLIYFGLELTSARTAAKDVAAHVHRNGWAIVAVVLALGWVGMAATIKRYHDRDKSGWWLLISLVPYVGALWQIVECGFLSGTPGGNGYGGGPGEVPVRTSSSRWEDDFHEYDYGSDAASARLARLAARKPEWAKTDEPAIVAPEPAEAGSPQPAPIRFGRRRAAA